MLPLLELSSLEVAANDGVAVPVDTVGEMLAGHADAGSLPVVQVVIVHEIPLLHNPLATVHLY